MKYNTNYHYPEVGQMFEKKGVNPFDESVIYTIKEERRDNMGNKWLHLESEHEHIYLPESDLFMNFVKVEYEQF